MGRDLTLYPRKASIVELKEYIESLGFQKCKHFWDWPQGTLNYSWFDERDFRSIAGVSADIFPVSGEELSITGNEWALHVRNHAFGSWHDVKMLNNVLRGARKLFGGTIKGDYGTNKYAPLWKDDSTPISRGVSAVFQRVDKNLSAVQFSLPDSVMPRSPVKPTNAKMRTFAEFQQSLDPVRVIYNGLVPFAVAMFEYFFSSVFKILIAYDSSALEKRETHKYSVDFPTLLQVNSGNRSIEDVIAERYSFQNLDQLNKAYQEWLKIDVKKVLFKKKRIGRKVSFLENRLRDIIQYRHGVVHRFEIDPSLTKKGILEILDAIEVSIIEFLSFLETKYKITVEK